MTRPCIMSSLSARFVSAGGILVNSMEGRTTSDFGRQQPSSKQQTSSRRILFRKSPPAAELATLELSLLIARKRADVASRTFASDLGESLRAGEYRSPDAPACGTRNICDLFCTLAKRCLISQLERACAHPHRSVASRGHAREFMGGTNQQLQKHEETLTGISRLLCRHNKSSGQ